MQQYADTALDVLTCGQIPPNPSELLQSHAMEMLLLELRTRYDVVILDAPPLLPVTDAALLAAQTDGAVVVVRHGKTTRDQLSTRDRAPRRRGRHDARRGRQPDAGQEAAAAATATATATGTATPRRPADATQLTAFANRPQVGLSRPRGSPQPVFRARRPMLEGQAFSGARTPRRVGRSRPRGGRCRPRRCSHRAGPR